MKCEKCGHKNEDGYLFCEQCGEKLTDFDESIKICSKCGNPNKSSHELYGMWLTFTFQEKQEETNMVFRRSFVFGFQHRVWILCME